MTEIWLIRYQVATIGFFIESCFDMAAFNPDMPTPKFRLVYEIRPNVSTYGLQQLDEIVTHKTHRAVHPQGGATTGLAHEADQFAALAQPETDRVLQEGYAFPPLTPGEKRDQLA